MLVAVITLPLDGIARGTVSVPGPDTENPIALVAAHLFIICSFDQSQLVIKKH